MCGLLSQFNNCNAEDSDDNVKLYNRIVWSSVSNVFDKSRNILMGNWLLSNCVVIRSTISSILMFLREQKLWSNLLHSDWSKFEIEHSDWSCAYYRQWASHDNTLLSLKCGALSDWSRAVPPPGGATGQLCRRI